MRRRFRVSPAFVVACLALFVALGSGAYAVKLKLKANQVKTKNIAAGAVTEPKLGAAAVTTPKFAPGATAPKATDADRLGGLTAGSYQKFCGVGAIKGTLVVDTTAATPAAYTSVVGFNCALPGNTTTSVQVKRVGAGLYDVKFLGPTTTGSAVVSARDSATGLTNVDAITTGEFQVQTANEPAKWSLIAF